MTKLKATRLKYDKSRDVYYLVNDLGKVALVFVVAGYTLFALYLWGPYIARGVQAWFGTH